jgi:hypothetical protein
MSFCIAYIGEKNVPDKNCSEKLNILYCGVQAVGLTGQQKKNPFPGNG